MNKKLSVKYLIAALLILVSLIGGVFVGIRIGANNSDQTNDINTLLVHREYLAKELQACIENNKGFDGYNEAYDSFEKANAAFAAENKKLIKENNELSIKIAEYDKVNAEWADYCTQGGIREVRIYE